MRLWNPRVRELLAWCLPALAVGLALRVLLTCQMPFGYYHADSPDFLTTPESLLLDHRFELHMKKTFLVPFFFTPPFLLHVPALIAIPIAQHLLGLALALMVGVLCRLWFVHWKWFVVPLTMITAVDPALLWFEHALLAETLFVFCTVLLAVAGTLYASQQTRARFVFLCAALVLEAGARPEGKLFFAFGIGLVFLVHFRAWRAHLPRLVAILLLAVVTDRLTRTSQGGLLLYTSVARLTPANLRCAPGFEPFIAAERADLQARWANKPSFPKVTDRRIIGAAVEDYLKAIPDSRLPDRHRRVNGLCMKLAAETCWRNLATLPPHVFAKFRYTANDAPNGLYDREWLFTAQHRAYADEAAHTLRLAPGLTGIRMASLEEVQRFVADHYRELPWFNAWSARWFAALNAWRCPDARFPGGPSSPHVFISLGVPIYFLLAAVGLLAIALRPGPRQRFHITWGLMLAGAFFVIMLTANVKPRFRLVFEPFWFIYLALVVESLALGASRFLGGRRAP
ncbi:MAG: hypothetical protein WCF18_21575 [Chthoniobacteraceae bacterium]